MRSPSLVRASVAVALVSLFTLAVACGGPAVPRTNAGGNEAKAACAGLDSSQCDRAKGLLQAASGFGNVRHEYLLDPASAMVPGRGVQKTPEGAYAVLPSRCAAPRAHGGEPSAHDAKVDPSTIDFSYVGVAIDQALVSADADLAPWLGVGGEASTHKISLVALAFVRDLDPQFFAASEDVAFGGDACACGRATHFVGSVKMGGLLAYEMTVRAGELRGQALSFVRSRIAAGDARVTQTVVGGLEVEGLEAAMGGLPSAQAGGSAGMGSAAPANVASAPKPLGFRVKNPVPIAYAVYPLSDVCKFSFPAPEVSPPIVDFGDVPYDREATRLLHVVNRASLDIRATIADKTFAIPALGSVDVPVAWKPGGTTSGCETQQREETLSFYPRDESAPTTPKVQSVRVGMRVRTGRGTYRQHEHIDSGTSRKPDYAGTRREWTCPPDYAVSTCRTEKAECGDGRCLTDGYAVNAERTPNGCRYACKGPEGFIPGLSSNFCRFDAVMECTLKCSAAPAVASRE